MGPSTEIERGVLALTGASAGLGRALALSWARPGARMILSARHSAPLLDVAAIAEGQGARVIAYPGDVGDDGFAKGFIAAAKTLGPVSHLVTNASSLGPVPLIPIADTPDEAWLEAVRTNLLGTVRLWREVLPEMESGLGGRLLTISSDAACAAYPHWGAYGATKAAVDHLVRILAEELVAHDHIDVLAYAVDPGDMATAMHHAAIPEDDPAGLTDPKDVAPVLVWLLTLAPPLASGRYTLDQVTAARKGGDAA